MTIIKAKICENTRGCVSGGKFGFKIVYGFQFNLEAKRDLITDDRVYYLAYSMAYG